MNIPALFAAVQIPAGGILPKQSLQHKSPKATLCLITRAEQQPALARENHPLTTKNTTNKTKGPLSHQDEGSPQKGGDAQRLSGATPKPGWTPAGFLVCCAKTKVGFTPGMPGSNQEMESGCPRRSSLSNRGTHKPGLPRCSIQASPMKLT